MNKPNRTVWLVSIGFFLNWLGFDGAQQYFVPLLHDQGRAGEAFTALILIYVCFLACSFVAPAILARIGTKAGLVLGALPYGFFLLFAVSGNTGTVYTLAVALGIGAALIWNASSQAIAAASQPSQLGRNLGLQYSLLQLGGLVGVLTGGILLRYLSNQQVFTYFAIFVGLSIICFLSTENVPVVPENKKVDFGYLGSRHALLLFPIIFAGYFVLIQVYGAFALIVSSLFGTTSLVTLATPVSIAAVAGSYLIGKSADRYPKVPLLLGLCVVGLVSIGLIVGTQQFGWLLLGALLMGLFFASVYPVVLALLKERVKEAEYTKAIGAFHLYTTAGMLAGLLASSFLESRLSYLPAVILLCAAIPALIFFDRKNPIHSSL